MKYIPFDKFSIQSPQSIDKIVRRLESVIEWDKNKFGFMKWPEPNKLFVGKVDYEGFVLERIIRSGKNDWQPLIIGNFKSELHGTTIEVKLRMRVFVILLSSVIVGFPAILTLFLVVGYFLKPESGPVFLGSAVFGALAYAIVTLAFNHGARKSKEALFKALNLTNVE